MEEQMMLGASPTGHNKGKKHLFAGQKEESAVPRSETSANGSKGKRERDIALLPGKKTKIL